MDDDARDAARSEVDCQTAHDHVHCGLRAAIRASGGVVGADKKTHTLETQGRGTVE